KETTLDMGPIGKYATTYKYTYEGQEDKLDKIKVDTTLKYSAPSEKAGGQLPFRIKNADLTSKEKESTGAIWFDREKGRIAKSSMKLKLEGSLTIEIGGMETRGELNQTQDSERKTSDTNPRGKKQGPPGGR